MEFDSYGSERGGPLRKEAIGLYISGKKPSFICNKLKRSRFWLFK
jgi:hypothetical protein